MAGSGTTLVECKLIGRRTVGVDINPDAVMVARNRLDFPDSILKQCDVVVAALHTGQRQTRREITGRIIGEREAYDADIDALLDLSDVNARKAISRGVKLATGTDAHNTGQFGFMDFGVDVARRGWLEKEDLMNNSFLEKLLIRIGLLRECPTSIAPRFAPVV